MTDLSARGSWRYPHTDADDVVETLHGVKVADPYRWLEDPAADRCRQWVAAQNQLTRTYLDAVESRRYFVDFLTAQLSTPRAGALRKQSGRYLRWCNDGNQEQESVYVADDLTELLRGGRLLLDPAEFGPSGRVWIADVSVSPDGQLAAYGLSEAGSDWVEWRVRDIETGADRDDRLVRTRYSRAEWLPDSSGFLYWAYPDHGRASGDNATVLGIGKLLLHRLGTPQSADEVVSYEPERPRERPRPKITDDGRWLILVSQFGTARSNRLLARRVLPGGQFGPPVEVVSQPKALYEPVGNDGDLLYLRTDEGAPRYRLVTVDLAALEAGGQAASAAAWRESVAEREQVLSRVESAGDGFLAVYLDDAAHRLYQISRDGTQRQELPLPGPVSVVDVSARAGDAEAFVGISSFVESRRTYRIDLHTGHVAVVPGETPAVGTPDVVTTRHHATSRDGTTVPYFLIRRADVPDDQPSPTILYGYGGFYQSMTPSYKDYWPAWLAAGGVLAVANLRGGGEYGRDWYEAGTRDRKQNVFDDFIAVGEQLVGSGVTTRPQLALHGRSNGGLLVGAVMTQRPDLAGCALPMVGVMDMLRFHRFTIGWAWIPDYGDPDVPEEFTVLHAYSPLHNVRVGTSYPATLVLTGDHDDRVVPAHSYKFAAALQYAQAGDAPVLARIETATGHGMGKPRAAVIAEAADLLAFAAQHTGLSLGDLDG